MDCGGLEDPRRKSRHGTIVIRAFSRPRARGPEIVGRRTTPVAERRPRPALPTTRGGPVAGRPHSVVRSCPLHRARPGRGPDDGDHPSRRHRSPHGFAAEHAQRMQRAWWPQVRGAGRRKARRPFGAPVGANTVFAYSIGAGPPTASGTDRGLTSPSAAAPRIRHGGTSAPRRRLGPRSPLGSTPRTVVVFPCATAKARDAGRLRLPDGRRVSFVAKPSLAPANPSVVYRRLDDRAPDGTTFRDMLVEYNLHPGENPWRLLSAWRLYRPVVYGELAREPGIANRLGPDHGRLPDAGLRHYLVGQR